MLHALTKRLIERIHQMSMERRIAWAADDLGSQCSFAADGFSVELLQGQAGPSVHIRNADGVIIERATPTDLGEERNAEGVSYHAMVADAFVLARRSALGVDAALERILLSLDGASAEVAADPQTTPDMSPAPETEAASEGEAIATDLPETHEPVEADIEISEADSGPGLFDEELEPAAPIDAEASSENDAAMAMSDLVEQPELTALEAEDQTPPPVNDGLAADQAATETGAASEPDVNSRDEKEGQPVSEASEPETKPVVGAMALGAIFAAVGAGALAATAPTSETETAGAKEEPAPPAPEPDAAHVEAASDEAGQESASDPAPSSWAFPEADAAPTDMPASVDVYAPADALVAPEPAQAAASPDEAQPDPAIVDAAQEHAPAPDLMAEQVDALAAPPAIAPEVETSAPKAHGDIAPDAPMDTAAAAEDTASEADTAPIVEAPVEASVDVSEPAEDSTMDPLVEVMDENPAPAAETAPEGEAADQIDALMEPAAEPAHPIDPPASAEPIAAEPDAPVLAEPETSASAQEPQPPAASASAPRSTDPWWLGGKAEPSPATPRSTPWWMTTAAGAAAAIGVADSASADPMADDSEAALIPTETLSDPMAQDQKAPPPAAAPAEAAIDIHVGNQPAAIAPVEEPAAPTPPPSSTSSSKMPWWTARAGAEGQAAPWWMQKTPASATMLGEANSPTILASAATDPSSTAEATQQSPPIAASGADAGSDIDAHQDMNEPERTAPDDQAASDAPRAEPASDASSLERPDPEPAELSARQMETETPVTDATASAEANEEEVKPETPWWLRAAQKVIEPLFDGDKTEEAKDEPAPAASATAAEPEASGVEDAAPASSPIQNPPADDGDDPYAAFRSSN